MRVQKTFIFTLLKRSAVCGFAVAGLFCGCSSSVAQRAGVERPSRFMNRIDAAEGAERLEAFRQQRLDGDFSFEFQLEYKPRRARTVRYSGQMWGSWNQHGPISRFRVSAPPEDDGSEQFVELIIQNGAVAQAWIRRSEEAPFRLIEGEALFEPILPDLLYSPFDLQMPFVYWDEFVYEGPSLVGATRVAQQFLMQPPAGSASEQRGVSGVRIGLDDTYNALWRIEVLDTSAEVISRFAVESVQKFQNQYIVKRITLTDYPTKDRTTFDVTAAAVGISLDPRVFSADLALSVDQIEPFAMRDL
jgi:hypothetical protein